MLYRSNRMVKNYKILVRKNKYVYVEFALYMGKAFSLLTFFFEHTQAKETPRAGRIN